MSEDQKIDPKQRDEFARHDALHLTLALYKTFVTDAHRLTENYNTMFESTYRTILKCLLESIPA